MPGTFYYVDTKNMWAVANRSCWETCPISTYPDNTNMICRDCPDYCQCQSLNPKDCLGCMNNTFLFDNRREKCFI